MGATAGQESVQTICDLPGGQAGGGSWNRDGVILLGSLQEGITRVLASGGAVSALTSTHGNGWHILPTLLPDGKHFLYLRSSRDALTDGVYMGSLDTKPEQQNSKRLLASGSAAVYVPGENTNIGQLLFVREGTLFAQRFDSRIPGLTGDPLPLFEGVARFGLWDPFSASENGVLVYVGGEQVSQATWFDGHGKVAGMEHVNDMSAALSPDGTRVAYADGTPPNIWLLDRSRNTSRPLTFGSALSSDPVWSPDGNRIAYIVNAGGAGAEYGLYQKYLNDSRDPELLVKSSAPLQPTDWSRDGRYLIYTQLDPKTKAAIWVLPMNGDRKPYPLLRSEFNEHRATLSPDMRWIAYVSDESGKEEIHVRPFNSSLMPGSPVGSDYLISKDGGWQVRWRRDGKELFYQTADGRIMSVDVTTTPVFRAGLPQVLFQAQPLAFPSFLGVTEDGRRFLVIPQGQATPMPFTVVLNWTSLLRK